MAWRVTMLVAVAVEAAAGFLPWLRTGERERNAYELVEVARSLDVLDTGLHRTLAGAWFLVPLAAALCWLAALLRWRRSAALIALAAGLLGALFAGGLERAATPVQAGVRATLVASLAVVVGSTVELWRAGRDELAPGGTGRRFAASGDAAR
jgi:hypothetical protein